jgi:hypothetical protein
MHRPLRNARVVVFNSLFEVGRYPDVETMIGILNDVDPNHALKVVAGAGFEPATFRL